MNVIEHYDILVDENNDPLRDPRYLQDYMDKWDGAPFLNAMQLQGSENVLEIGVGTGRLAIRVLPLCKSFTGIDISPKTIERARENLLEYHNADLICADFNNYCFNTKFDIIYSSLTLFHFEDKQAFVNKVASLLAADGRFVLSIDKSQSTYIDMGTRKLRIYPDTLDNVTSCLSAGKMVLVKHSETEFAHILIAEKRS